MPLADGDVAADGDIWFRVATQQGYLYRGRVHHSAFGGNALSSPKKNRSWSRELSGRLRSLAGTTEEIRADATAFCSKHTKPSATLEFAGVIYVAVTDAKKQIDGMTTGVRYTPQADDPAHADFTFAHWTPVAKADQQRLALELVDVFRVLYATQLEFLPEV